jgi:hypothetical protein
MSATQTFDAGTIQGLLTTQGLQGLMQQMPMQPPDLSDVQVEIWQKRWNIQAGAIRSEQRCYVSYTPQTQVFTFGSTVTLNVIGKTITFKKEFPVNGDTQKTLDLPFNCKLRIDIHSFTYSQQQLAFDLLLRFRPTSPFRAWKRCKNFAPCVSTAQPSRRCKVSIRSRFP